MIETTLVAAFVSISRDHMGILGDHILAQPRLRDRPAVHLKDLPIIAHRGRTVSARSVSGFLQHCRDVGKEGSKDDFQKPAEKSAVNIIVNEFLHVLPCSFFHDMVLGFPVQANEDADAAS